MYAVTAGSENSVNSVYTSAAATSRSIVRSPCRGGSPSVHASAIEYSILADCHHAARVNATSVAVKRILANLSQAATNSPDDQRCRGVERRFRAFQLHFQPQPARLVRSCAERAHGRPGYSSRKATRGLIAAARNAGIEAAIIATTSRAAAATE